MCVCVYPCRDGPRWGRPKPERKQKNVAHLTCSTTVPTLAAWKVFPGWVSSLEGFSRLGETFPTTLAPVTAPHTRFRLLTSTSLTTLGWSSFFRMAISW